MKFFFALIVVFQVWSFPAHSADLKGFLKRCAYGSLIGAGLGTVTLAFSDRPSDDLNNIARGASLGLYAGIAYGLVQMNRPEPASYQEPSFGLSPLFEEGRVNGVRVSSILWSF